MAPSAGDGSITVALPAPGEPALFIDRGAADRPQVSLTFHMAGDPKVVVRLLDLLKERTVAVTVFIVGSFALEQPDIAARVLADGHELANHTQNHRPMRTLSAEALLEEISVGRRTVEQFAGPGPQWFRPSGIEVPTSAILAAAGVAGYPVSVGYSLDTDDYQDPGVDHVVAKVRDEAVAGSIISVHFGHADTIGAMPAILDHLAAAGLAPVTVGALLSP